MSLASTIRAKNLEFWFLPKDAMSKKILFPVGGTGLEPGLLRAVGSQLCPAAPIGRHPAAADSASTGASGSKAKNMGVGEVF